MLISTKTHLIKIFKKSVHAIVIKVMILTPVVDVIITVTFETIHLCFNTDINLLFYKKIMATRLRQHTKYTSLKISNLNEENNLIQPNNGLRLINFFKLRMKNISRYYILHFECIIYAVITFVYKS